MKIEKKRGQCLSEIGSRWWQMEPEDTDWIGVRRDVLPVAPPGERRNTTEREKKRPFKKIRRREERKEREERE